MGKEKKLIKWIIVAIFSLPLAHAKSPSTYFQLKSEVNKTSHKHLSHLVNEFVKVTLPSRMVGLPGHEKARTFIEDQIKKADPKSKGKLSLVDFNPDIAEAKRFYQADFDAKIEGKFPKTDPMYIKWHGFTQAMISEAEKRKEIKGKNIIWEKAGLNPDKVLVITAHYDTISHDLNTAKIRENDPMPGANYNATGVALNLSLIRILSEFEANYSVQVVFLDWQGIGFLGSYQHAKDLKKSGKEILGVINLEMLGQDTSYFDKTKKLGNMKVYLRSHPEEEKWVKGFIQHGPKFSTKVNFEIFPNGIDNSDHFRYQDEGFKAATFSQNWEDDFNPKFYQTPQDTPETLNHETFYQVYQYLAGAVGSSLLDLTK